MIETLSTTSGIKYNDILDAYKNSLRVKIPVAGHGNHSGRSGDRLSFKIKVVRPAVEEFMLCKEVNCLQRRVLASEKVHDELNILSFCMRVIYSKRDCKLKNNHVSISLNSG